MKKKRLFAGLMLGVMSFVSVTPMTTQANERETMLSVTKEGQYVVKDYKQLYDEDYDTCEVLFKPEKTGVYSLTSSIKEKCGKVTMEVFDDNHSFDEVFADGKDKDNVEVNKKVYLEKGISYYVWVYVEDNETLETFDFDIKCIGEGEVKPKVEADLVISDDESVPFDKVDMKGFKWNKETSTLSLDNCKLKGAINLKVDKNDYDYDTKKFIPVFTIDVKGKSSIEGNNNNAYVIEKDSYEDRCDVLIKGEGKNKSKFSIKNYDASIDLDNDDSLTIENINFKANRLWMNSEKLYINNSKMKFMCDWYLTSEEEDIPDRRVTPLYSKYFCTFCNTGTYINNSNIVAEMELIPKKYLKRFANRESALFIALDKFKNSKVTIKGSKEYIKGLKSGKYKIFSYPTKKEKKYVKKFKYVSIKSYRNAEKKGSIISGEVNYSKKYKTEVISRDVEYKVIKQASTDGKLVGKVYVANYDGKMDNVTINDIVCIEGARYKVIGISKKAFAKAKKLKRINIKSKSLKKIGKNAFNNSRKITFEIPKAKENKYKKLIKKSGIKKYTIKSL